MENRNELVAQMAAKLREEHIKTIESIVYKYYPSLKIDTETLSRFAQQMIDLSSSWFGAEKRLDDLTDGWRPDVSEQDALISEIEKIKAELAAKAETDPAIYEIAKAKFVSSMLTFKAGQYSEKISAEEQNLLDIRESYRLDEFDPSTDEVLAGMARAEHPDYRNIERSLEENNATCDMIDKDRSDLNSAIAGYEKDAFINHNSYESTSHYSYWPTYKPAVDARVTQIEETREKGGKKNG